MIHRIKHVTNTPLKDVSEFLTVYAMRDIDTITDISKSFKRAIWIDETFYNGNINVSPIEKRLHTPTDLISIKFKAYDFERIAKLAYALDCTPTRTTAILIEHASCNVRAVNEYVYQNMVSELTPGQMQELRKVLTYVNRYNIDNSSWLSVLSRIVGDVRPATKKLYDLVNEFLKGQ